MTEQSPDTPQHNTDGKADPRPGEGTPRWVKVSGLIALVVVVLALIMMVLGGPEGHGPGRHGLSMPASGWSLPQGHA